MATPPQAHAEMNAIIHHALRRDLDRLDQVLSGPLASEQRAAVCAHIAWMLDVLHVHHVAEDEGVWPRTLAKRPDLAPMLEQMESEHQALAQASDGLRAAAAAYRDDDSDDAREAVQAAVAHMQATTLPHLDHEETEAMPLVVEALDDEDWEYLEKNHFQAGESFSQQCLELMWLMDDLGQQRSGVIRGVIPRPVFWIASGLFGRRYDRDAARRWGALAGSRG